MRSQKNINNYTLRSRKDITNHILRYHKTILTITEFNCSSSQVLASNQNIHNLYFDRFDGHSGPTTDHSLDTQGLKICD
jgi:hypothetical protein